MFHHVPAGAHPLDFGALAFPGGHPLAHHGGSGHAAHGGHHMAMDITETKDEYRISADLPGFKKDDITITLDDDVLTLAATRNEEHDENTTNYHVKERRYGKVQRSIRLPKIADTDSVRAQYQDGVLRICVDKKREKPSAKTISITGHDYPFSK